MAWRWGNIIQHNFFSVAELFLFDNQILFQDCYIQLAKGRGIFIKTVYWRGKHFKGKSTKTVSRKLTSIFGGGVNPPPSSTGVRICHFLTHFKDIKIFHSENYLW